MHYTHARTHFRAMEYLLVPDSLSLTKKLASLQRCSWASACCRLTLPWYQLGEAGEGGEGGLEKQRDIRSGPYRRVTCGVKSHVMLNACENDGIVKPKGNSPTMFYCKFNSEAHHSVRWYCCRWGVEKYEQTKVYVALQTLHTWGVADNSHEQEPNIRPLYVSVRL